MIEVNFKLMKKALSQPQSEHFYCLYKKTQSQNPPFKYLR